MWFRNLLRFWMNWKTRKTTEESRKTITPTSRWVRSLLTLEPLENRWAPATFTVTSLGDELGSANGDGTGDTLRECLFSANTNNNSPTNDVIVFAAGLKGGTIVLDENANLYLAEDVIIDGGSLGDFMAGVSGIRVDFNGLYHIELNAGATYLRIDNFDLFDGFSVTDGGAIQDAGADLDALVIENLTISSSEALDDGGAIFLNNGGDLIIDNVDFLNNDAYYNGGAVAVHSTGDFVDEISITNSLFDNNDAGVGPGPGIKPGNCQGGAFYVDVDGDLDGDIEITGSTFSNNTAYNFNTADGGAVAIRVSGDLLADREISITDCIFDHNIAEDGGGAVYLRWIGDIYGIINIDSTTFTDNDADFDGGGLYFLVNGNFAATAEFNIYDSSFEGNTTSTDAGGGASLYFKGAFDGDVNVVRSEFSGNQADGNGGGFYLRIGGASGNGDVNIRDSTFDNNSAYESGGGIYVFAAHGDINLVNSTIAYNHADNDGGGIAFYGLDSDLDVYNSTIARNEAFSGGGIFASPDGAVYLSSTIVAENAASSGVNLAGSADFSASYSLIGDSSGPPVSGTHNIIGEDPLLGPLADNGGPTETMKLLAGSPAIDAGENSLALADDQRGAGYDRDVDETDIGAYELQGIAVPAFVAGAGPGGAATIQVFRAGGSLITTLDAFPGFAGGVTVALGDVNDDGIKDVIAGAGAGGAPHVKVFDGVTFTVIESFFAFTSSFPGGVYVASGDVDGDGFDDIIVGAGPGGGPHVKVFDVTGGGSTVVLESFFAFPETFQGGVRVAAGDVNDDGFDDVIAGAGPGGGPHVRVFDVTGGGTPPTLESFFAFASTFRGGVFVAGGDVDGDGFDDIVVGAGAGGGPHVVVLDVTGTGSPVAIESFFAFTPAFTGGVRVGSDDINNDGFAEVIAGPGPGGRPHIKVFDDTIEDVLESFFFPANPVFGGGVFVNA